VSGGGLALTDESSAELSDMEVVQNVASDSRSARGGGVLVGDSTSIKVQHTTIRGNLVEGVTHAYGGGFHLRVSCSAKLLGVEVLDNAAKLSGRGFVGYALGGALYANEGTKVIVSTSLWQGNTASNAISPGGG
jgi:hypothetical protein